MRYQRDGGTRSYNWVRIRLQEQGVVVPDRDRGKHRQRREPSPCAGMMLPRDGSTYVWVSGQWDLIETMDDATNGHYPMFFCEEEGLWSSLRGMREVVETKGLCCSLYTDRGSQYWTTPEAGGKVDRDRLRQFGRVMVNDLGIGLIPAYSPEARGRSERTFRTHQDRLVKELALEGITDRESANRHIQETCLSAFNKEFSRPPREKHEAFVPLLPGTDLDAVFCERHDRVVGKDNCVQFDNPVLQLPPDGNRPHHFKTNVKGVATWMAGCRSGTGCGCLAAIPRMVNRLLMQPQRQREGNPARACTRQTEVELG